MLNMARSGLDTAAGWMDYGNKPQPSDYKPSEMLAPLGAGLMGTAFAPQNALGIFGGRLAKTADHNALAKAEELAAKGADRREIWDQTGWFQGADGKWRFEIDDSASAVHPMVRDGEVSRWSLKDGINMQEALSHPSLYAAYPDTAGIGSSGKITGLVDKVMGGDVNGVEGFYGISAATGAPIIHMEASNPENMRRGLLHELQHDVQQREGFAPGASLARSKPALQNELVRPIDERLKAAMEAYPEDAATFRKFEQTREKLRSNPPNANAVIDEQGRLHKRLMKTIGGMTLYDLEKQRSAVLRSINEDWQKEAYKRYARTSGEVEARNVEARRDMTPEERRAKPPWETEDVLPVLQTVRQK